MALRTNQQMLELLGGDPAFFDPNCQPIPQILLAQLDEGFKEVEGCIVPESFQDVTVWSENRPRVNNVDDETSFECLLSKVNIDDFVDSNFPLSELARIGCGYAMCLRKALLASPISGNFRIIVDAQAADLDLKMGPICSVRFHKIRADQAWLASDLETYKENGLLVVDFEKGGNT